MRRFSLYHGLPALVATLALMATNPANAQLLAPAGLNPGDTFRFVFLTPDTTVATSTSIGDYDIGRHEALSSTNAEAQRQNDCRGHYYNRRT